MNTICANCRVNVREIYSDFCSDECAKEYDKGSPVAVLLFIAVGMICIGLILCTPFFAR